MVEIPVKKKSKINVFPILLAIVVLNFILSGMGIIPKKYLWFFIWFALAMEVLLSISVLVKIRKVISENKRVKALGQSGFVALQHALEMATPKLIAKIATLELKMYYTMYLSLIKRNNKDDPNEFNSQLGSYSFFAKALLVISILEITAVHFALPAHWFITKVILLILGIWSTTWIVADLNAMKFYRHTFMENGIKFQMGLRTNTFVPFSEIASVNQTKRVVPNFSLGPSVPKEEPGNLYLAAGENCNVLICLKTPTDFDGMVKDFESINQVWLSLENASGFTERLSERIG